MEFFDWVNIVQVFAEYFTTAATPEAYIEALLRTLYISLGVAGGVYLICLVLGGLGNIWGSVVATVVLYVLPEALRGMDQLRMLVYAIVLILVMLATNNPVLQGFMDRIGEKFKRQPRKAAAQKGGASHE